jgi:outer membrane protein assembly factor BamB
VVAAAAGGVWYWQRGGGSGAGGIAAEAGARLTLKLEDRFPEDWKPHEHAIEYSVGAHVEGRWWTEGHLVREMSDEVIAYDLANGSETWRVPVPGNGFCRASREMSPEGYVAIMRGDGFPSARGKGCHQLTLVDINAGKEVWTVELDPIAKKFPTAAAWPVIANGMVHVGGQGRALADGSLALRPSREAANGGICDPADFYGVSGVLLAWQECIGGGRNERERALIAFGEDMKPAWKWNFPKEARDTKVLTVLSVDPLLVVVSKDRVNQEVWRVEPSTGEPDKPGKHSVVATSGGDIGMPCMGGSGGLGPCSQVVVGDGVVYLQTRLEENGRQFGVVAIDVATGKERWRARADGELSLSPFQVDEDGRLIAYQAQADTSVAKDLGYESPGVVVALDPGSGSLTALAALPQAKGKAAWENVLENTDLDANDLDWYDGHLVIRSPAIVVTKEGGGGGANSMATLIYS